MTSVLRRLLIVLLPLWIGLFAALFVPLAANIAQRETQTVYADRVDDAVRFASLADDGLRRGRMTALSDEITQYDQAYGVAVALYATDGRLLMASRPSFDSAMPEIRTGLTTAFAGYRNVSLPAALPWRREPIVVVEPVGRDVGVVAAVVTVSPTDKLRSAVLRRWEQMAALGVLPFALAVVASVGLAQWVLRPVRGLDQATVAIAAGRLDARAATVAGPPELRRLADAFNRMIDIVARTLRRQRTFVSDASHQLRNPLASLRLALDNLAEHVGPSGKEHHEIARAEVEEMSNVVDNLLALTAVEGATLARTPQAVSPMIESRRGRWQQVAAAAGMELTVEVLDGDITTLAPVDAIGNLLDELVGNACRLSGGSTVRVVAASVGPDAVLSVRDNGVGLSDDELAKVGNRFWRGRAQADTPGTGLGLAICTELVAAWGGSLTVHQLDPKGLEARITLPAAARARAS